MNLKQFPKKLDSKTSCLRITVPENLDLALEGLIRKVLREQPKVDDIYSFAANYFETLLKIRDKIGANYATAQLCPFHNDEDAHEMIKLAGTFSKPEKFKKNYDDTSSNGRKKDIRRPKPQTVKEKKIVKQSTPDLIRKLPMTTENEELKVRDKKPKEIEEKVEIDGEFLTSDPIKELVEKELMMEGKENGKNTASDVRGFETPKAKPEKRNKEEQKLNEGDIQPEVKEKNEENSIKINTKEVNKETRENAEKVEDVKTSADEVKPDKDETKEKVENFEIKMQPSIQEAEIKEEKNEKSPRSQQIPPKEQTLKEVPNEDNLTFTTNVKTVEPSEAPKQEEKMEKATGGQQPETEIDEETKETNENKTKTPAEVLSVGSLVTNLADALNNNVEEKSVIKNEHKNLENLNETTKEVLEEEKSRDVSKGEEKVTKVEVEEANKEPDENENKNEEKLLSIKRRDNEDNISKDENKELEAPKESTTEVKNETNKEREILKGNENDQHDQTSEISKPEEAKPIDTTEPKEEKPLPEGEKIETPNVQTQTNQIQEETNKDSNHTIEKPMMETQNPVTDDQKPKPVENSETKENDAEKLNTPNEGKVESQKPKEVQPEPNENQKTKPIEGVDVQNKQEKAENGKKEEETDKEELCTVVDVSNIQKEDATEGNKTENEKEEETTQKKEESNLEKEKDTKNIIEKEQGEKKQTETNSEKETAVENERNTREKEEDLKTEDKTQSKEETNTDELCTVVDIENIPKGDTTEKTENEKLEKTLDAKNETKPEEQGVIENIRNLPENEEEKEITPKKEDETSKEQLHAEEIAGNLPKEDKTEENVTENESKELRITADESKTEMSPEEINQIKDNETTSEELCTVVDIENIPKEQTTDETHKEGETSLEELSKVEAKNLQEITNELTIESKQEITDTQPPHIIEPEKVKNSEVVQPPEEFQIKTIQTHYYHTLQVPETVTKEYIVHNVATPLDYKNTTEEKIEFLENINDLSPPEKQYQHDVESTTQRSDTDDLLDIMTPTSGYSLNLSEISWQTASGMFLESERQYSSLEKEEVRYTTPKSNDQNRQEVEEFIQKTVIPTGVDAVPVPPRNIEEISAEETNTESVKEKKEEKPEGDSESSTESANCDTDAPYISVEVKTVIETQILDEEEEEDAERKRPSVEVTVEATIDIQDDVGMPQSLPNSIEEENKISKEKSQEIKSSVEEVQSTSKDEQQKESSSTEQTTGKEGSSGESDSTISSAPTEIKRTDSAKRNFNSTRSLLSTQSLDLGKRNPLVKTRSLSTFRHGVTDFEVWNTIEKELEEAATKIQSKFRGYKTRKKLQRENAVQITTEESSPSTTPAEGEVKEEGQQSTGEFHDSIVLAEHPR